jgi:hypothetical protein
LKTCPKEPCKLCGNPTPKKSSRRLCNEI